MTSSLLRPWVFCVTSTVAIVACSSESSDGGTAGTGSVSAGDSATQGDPTLSSTSGISASGGTEASDAAGSSGGESADSSGDAPTDSGSGESGNATTSGDESSGSETGDVPTDMPGELVFSEPSEIEGGWFQSSGGGSTQYRPAGEIFSVAVRDGVTHIVNDSSSSSVGIRYREDAKGDWAVTSYLTDPDLGYAPNSLAVALDSRGLPSIAIGGLHFANPPASESSAHAYFFDGYMWQVAHPAPWVSGPAPRSIDMAIDSTNQRHVVYVARWEGGNQRLVYATADETGQSWSLEALELDRPVSTTAGACAIAVDGNDGVHVAYSHDNPGAMGNESEIMITYAHSAGGGAPWTFETVEDYLIVRPWIDLAVSDDGVPHIVFAELMNTGTWHTTSNAGTWSAELVDDEGVVGFGPSIAVDTYGRPHVSYVDNVEQQIRYGRLLEGGWDLYAPDDVYVDGVNSLTCSACRTSILTDLALDEDGMPVIAVGGFDLNIVRAEVP